MNDSPVIPASLTIPVTPGANIPLVNWQDALDTFLNTLSSPRIAKAYQRADIIPLMLAQSLGGLVARLGLA